ncbi:hypothetical protein [Metallosphaera javensis (ex Sakai et al. 2022)]|uniref:hypothetical protein n=1 Tax=Metallosphaera javensis (ex Sakai et al. 2022) TaxID=2775498 RepID=UPI0025850835|nr:MAG: hypothetical protein MjAS7_1053 [Metallosphaera javensis (ex Sakai et al. 2022)]BCS92673.1 MAG: hypothetical protein MjAS7_1281 [Metallosphaera javensis (ex Sakai et al. 2022)]
MDDKFPNSGGGRKKKRKMWGFPHRKVSGVIPLMGVRRMKGLIRDFGELQGSRIEYKVEIQ